MAVDPGRLDGVALFADVAPEDRARLAGAMRERTVEIGTVLSKESDLATHVFVIEEGRIAVSTSSGFVTLLGPGDVVGEIGAMEQVRRTANVVAVTDLTVLALMGWDFRELTQKIPELGDRIKETIHSRLSELDEAGGA